MNILELTHEKKIVQMHFIEGMTSKQISHKLNFYFGEKQIASFIAKSNAIHDNESVIVPSLINYLT